MAPKAEPKAKAKADAKPKAKGEPRKKPEAAKEGEIAHIPAPDRDAFDEKTKAIQEAIDKLQAEQRSITDAINKRSGGKEEFYAKKAELRAQLDEFSQKINALQEQKDGIQKAMGEKRAESLQMKSDLTKMKKSIGFASEDEIDQRIASIEFKLWTDTVPLKEEKKMLQEMQELKRNRPKVAQVLKMEEGLNNFDAGGGVKQTLQTINEQIRNWMQEKSKVLEERDALNKEYEGKLGDQNAYEERNELNQKIKEKQEERSKIREEFREEERKFRELLNKKRQEQQERYAAERESRQKEWEERNRQKKVEKLDEQPFVTEITLIEQTIKFCKSLTGGKEVEKEEEKKDAEMKDAEAKEGEAKEGEEAKEAEKKDEPAEEKEEKKAADEPENDGEDDELDVFGVENILDTGKGKPLFEGFTWEDWALLSLRYELYLLVHAFRKDVNDPERPGIHTDHVQFYYNRYFRKSLNTKSYGVETYGELVTFIKDTVSVNKKNSVLEVHVSDELDNFALFLKLTEECRRERRLMLDSGDESCALKFNQQALSAGQGSYGSYGRQNYQRGGWNNDQGGGGKGYTKGQWQSGKDQGKQGGGYQSGGHHGGSSHNKGDSYKGGGGKPAGGSYQAQPQQYQAQAQSQQYGQKRPYQSYGGGQSQGYGGGGGKGGYGR